MLFQSKLKPDQYEVRKEGQDEVMLINADGSSYAPSIEDDKNCMRSTILKLVEVPSITKIIFVQRRNYEYEFDNVQLLTEIATIYNHLSKRKKSFSVGAFTCSSCGKSHPDRYNFIQGIINNLLLYDPIGAYVELRRTIREQKILSKSYACIDCSQNYMALLEYFMNLLEKTKLIILAQPYFDGYHLGDRSVYRRIFRVVITPNFMYTKLMSQVPLGAEILDSYKIGKDAEVTIYDTNDDIKHLYHLSPPEFRLSEEKYELLEMARMVLAEHKPKEEDFSDPEKMRSTFFNIGRDLIQELAEHKNIELSWRELKDITNILVRYTVGFGLIEVLLQDQKIQDITINGPIGQTKIFIVHQDYDDCVTNIMPAYDDSESWATKFRLLSGRPLDEANPVLDTELILPDARARVAIISRPLNPWGLGYAFRRHRDKPWTMPLFVNNGMLRPMASGLMSFLIDGSRTVLVAGTRSSGKTSLLGSFLVEIMRKYRILTVEDTMELPTEAMRSLGYNIQPMKVMSALSKGGNEIAADEGIRTSLRLGDSALIVGEIRSSDALALYEAMRVGALANVVAGTIHGANPYGVFDRVVNDLGVPRTSFKATDIIVVANPIKSSDGLKRWRRVTQITEVRKTWEDDPLKEGGFVDLMRYDSKTDRLEPTDDLINGNSEILKDIAGNIKDYAGNWDAVWENILLRSKTKGVLVDYANKTGKLDLLEAPFVIKSNDVFHKISAKIKDEIGFPEPKRIYADWEDWFKKELRYGK